ncbi:DUF2975 domain-containing protein [Spirosoma sp. 209]|uniref:DUF2975 domain-containing protein n=1 Tax=Spirosoma sp. 209 TaxID=1955701 RepID=UPI00098D1C41|nr:DUF2975 domain-containing protein [Spirosoma sp. 209]
MSTTNITVLKIMNVLFWIIFIGLCIKTGALLFSFSVSLFVSPAGTRDLYMGLNLSELYNYNLWYYVHMALLIIALNGLKAYIAYLVVKIFMKFDLAKPFNPDISTLIAAISHTALGAGILAMIANGSSDWLMKRGVDIPANYGAGEILFFAGVIYIIAIVFRKGTELQTENDLTV